MKEFYSVGFCKDNIEEGLFFNQVKAFTDFIYMYIFLLGLLGVDVDLQSIKEL